MIKIITGEFDEELKLPLADMIKAGFPSPADDYMRESLDFNRDLIKNPEATFYGRVDSDSMEDAGICDGDIIVAYVDGEFTMKFLDLKNVDKGYILLRPANNKYPPIRIEYPPTISRFGTLWCGQSNIGSNPCMPL